MSDGVWSDELLMAYADGELDPSEAARVAAAAAADGDVRTRIEDFRASRRLVHDAVAPVADAPVPSALVDAIRRRAAEVDPDVETGSSDNVVAFPSRRTRSRTLPTWALPLAASIALVLGAGGGYLAGGDMAGGTAATVIAGVDPQGLGEVLDRVPAGSAAMVGDATVAMLGTFEAAGAELCREFRLTGADAAFTGIACLDQETWQPRLLVRAATPGAEFAPASGNAALEAYIAEVGGGPLVTGTDEASLLERLR